MLSEVKNIEEINFVTSDCCCFGPVPARQQACFCSAADVAPAFPAPSSPPAISLSISDVKFPVEFQSYFAQMGSIRLRSELSVSEMSKLPDSQQFPRNSSLVYLEIEGIFFARIPPPRRPVQSRNQSVQLKRNTGYKMSMNWDMKM